MLKDPVTKNDHVRGNKDSAIVLVEYGDFECPYCAIAHSSVNQLLQYVKNDLCYVFRNFPLVDLHPHAQLCAETAEFAADHNKYWEMHDLIFNNQEILNPDLMLELVVSLNLPVDDFRKALKNRTYLPVVKAHLESGLRNQVHSTPSFFINNERYEGPYDFENLVNVIELVRGVKKAS